MPIPVYTCHAPESESSQGGKPDSESGFCPFMASKNPLFGPMKELFRRDAWKVILIAVLTVIGLLAIRACLQQ